MQKQLNNQVILWILLLAFGCKEPAQEKVETVPNKTAETAKPKAETPPALKVLRWEENSRHRFEMTLNSTMFGADGMPMVKMSITSAMNALSAETKSHEDLVLAVLVNPEVSIEGESAPTQEQLDGLVLELSQPVWGRYRDGKLLKVHLPEKPSVYAVGVWRTVLSAMQASMSLNGGETYETSEFDGNGEYKVLYRKTGEGKWSKTKLSYLNGLHAADTESPVGTAPAPRLISSKGEVEIADNLLNKVSFSETIEVPLSGASGLKGETTFSLTRKQSTAVSQDAKIMPPATALVLDANEPFVQELPIDAMDKERMKGLTFEKTLKALIARSRDPRKKALWAKKNEKAADTKEQKQAEQWTEDWARYFAALPAFFRQQPETLKIAEKEIRADNPATTSLLGGLSSSGNPAAQEVLVRIALDDKPAQTLRESAVRNLVQCTRPSKKTADIVWKLAENSIFSRYAVFGIGIIARKMRKAGEIDEAAAIIKQLIERLEKVIDPHEKRDVLRGISNTGDPAALSAVKPLLQSDNATIRGGAVEAVRLMEIPEADDIIAERISHKIETASGVRASAVRAASNRSHEDPILKALLNAATEDPDKKVKKEARKLLFSWSKDSPELTAILEQIADVDEKVEEDKDTDKM